MIMINNVYPLVTIAIPTYNRAHCYLRQAIQYALDQTYSNLEIIVSDNCSTDNTEMIVKEFNDPRIRYFKHSVNIGANNNFNFCLNQAKGSYFLLFHDDDLIDNDFVEVCMKASNYSTDIGIIRTGMRRINSDGKVLNEKLNLAEGLSIEDLFLNWFAGKAQMYLCSTLFNTNLLKQIGGFNSRHQLFQDVLAEVQLAAKYGRVDVKDAKASVRVHSAQNTNLANINAWCEDSLILLNTMCDLVPKKKALVRSKGMRFFTKRNYRLVTKIKSPMDRFRTYFAVYKMFDYQYSPLRFFIDSILINRVKQIRRKVKHLLRIKQVAIASLLISE